MTSTYFLYYLLRKDTIEPGTIRPPTAGQCTCTDAAKVQCE